MNLQRVESFAREVQAMTAQLESFQSQVDQLNGLLRIAQKQGNLEQAKKFVDQRKLLEDAMTSTTQVLYDRANRDSVERVREFVVDLFAKIRISHEEFERWRAEKAQFDLRVGLEDGFDRVAEERRLDSFRGRYERAVELAGEMVPERPVVLIP